MSETRSYSDTWPGMATELAALRTLATAAERRMDEFWRRVDKIEDRLAAIERATVPPLPAIPDDESGEPEDCEPVVAREPSVVYPDAPPFHVGQVVECVAYPTESLKIGDRRKIVEAEIISGRPCYRLEGLEFGIFGDCHNRRFRVVESTTTAERESEPTPGPCVVCGYEAWQKLVESGGHLCRVCDLAGRARDAETMEREHRSTIADLRQQLATVTTDREQAINTIKEVVGKDANGTVPPTLMAFVGAMLAEYEELQMQLATARAAAEASAKDHEAMEWLNEKRCRLVFGFNYGCTTKGWFLGGDLGGTYATPTAAILAAKAAATPTTPPDPRP